MAGSWDDTLKKLISDSPQDFVTWLLPDARYEGQVERELPQRTVHADYLLAVSKAARRGLLEIELQRDPDDEMSERLLEYNIQATRNDKEEHRPVYSCVIYLKKHENVAVSPLVRTFIDGEQTITFRFHVVKLWEYTAEQINATGLLGLLPLIPLTKDGQRRKVVQEMVNTLVAEQRKEGLSLSYLLASMVIEHEDDLRWVKEIYQMHNEILRDTWAYKEIYHEGEVIGEQRGEQRGLIKGEILALQKVLLELVCVRFPDLVPVAEAMVANCTDAEKLQNAVIKISATSTTHEAIDVLALLVKKAK